MPRLDYSRIAPTIMLGIKRYVEEGVPNGSFLTAVFENNLMEAFMNADEYNIETMFHIVGYIYNEVPSNLWGSREKVRLWIQEKAAERQNGVEK